MPLESALNITELDANNPVDGEGANYGDDHLRLIKGAIKTTFGAFTGAENVALKESELNNLPQNVLDAVQGTIDLLLPHTEQKGSIKPWSTIYAPIPAGWQLCDGSEAGIPDLRDRFVIGSGGAFSVGTTGGSATANTSEGGEHNHGGATAGHALTEAQMPSHNHTLRLDKRVVADDATGGAAGEIMTAARNYAYDNRVPTVTITSKGGNQTHAHNIGSSGTHTHSVSIQPPFYALAYIIKTSEVTGTEISDLLTSLTTSLSA